MIPIFEATPAAEGASIFSRMSLVVQTAPRGFLLTKKADWAAAPFERSMHLTASFQQRLVRELTKMRFPFLYAVAFELRDSLTPAFRVAISDAGLAAFNHECGPFNYVLCPPDMSAVVLCSASGDYIVVAGRSSFIEALGGTDLGRVYESFRQGAEHPSRTPRERAFFLSLLSTLQEGYDSAEDGASVTFSPGSSEPTE